jgi:hypothetical protein
MPRCCLSWMINVWSFNKTITLEWNSSTCAEWPGASSMLFPGHYISTSGMTNLLPPPGIRALDLPAHGLFLTRAQIVSCRHYYSYHCDLNFQEWWTSEQTKNTYRFHWQMFVEYTTFAIHASCVCKHQSKTKRSTVHFVSPTPRPDDQLWLHLIESGCEVTFFRQHGSSARP